MTKQKSPLVSVSSKDILSFLEEVRLILGLNRQQMDTMILLLVEAEGAHLHFRIGNINVLFGSDTSDDSGVKEISVEMCASQKNFANTISYKIPPIYLDSVKKKNSFVKSG
jgi:hypothetical protein